MNNKNQHHINASVIRQAILNPESSPLGPDLDLELHRMVTACSIIWQIPDINVAIEVHISRHPELSHSEAKTHILLASKMIQMVNNRYSGDSGEIFSNIILNTMKP
jgi:hypothetical protein